MGNVLYVRASECPFLPRPLLLAAQHDVLAVGGECAALLVSLGPQGAKKLAEYVVLRFPRALQAGRLARLAAQAQSLAETGLAHRFSWYNCIVKPLGAVLGRLLTTPKVQDLEREAARLHYDVARKQQELTDAFIVPAATTLSELRRAAANAELVVGFTSVRGTPLADYMQELADLADQVCVKDGSTFLPTRQL